jgi:hypothetical protein
MIVGWDGVRENEYVVRVHGAPDLLFVFGMTTGGAPRGLGVRFRGEAGGVIPREEAIKLKNLINRYLREVGK